jgi:hypothetical protein
MTIEKSKPLQWSLRVAFIIGALACTAAMAAGPPSSCGSPGPGGGGSNNQVGKEPPPPTGCPSTSSAPEMDVGSATAGLTLLIGGLFVLQGSHRRKPQ